LPEVKRIVRVIGALALSAGLVGSTTGSASAPRRDVDEAALRYGASLATQAATRARLGVLGDAIGCSDAQLVAYRRSTVEPEIVDHWYQVSQLWADLALLAASPGEGGMAGLVPEPFNTRETRCRVEKGFLFLEHLWDSSNAGYLPRSTPAGTAIERSPRYADDNALAGLVLLVAADMASDPTTARHYVGLARRQADFLRDSDMWDETFEGGFWWNTARGNSREGKPAQTNALAALFFGRLYQHTGDPLDREWALRTLWWLDSVLFDSTRSLYRWSVTFEDLSRRTGSTIRPRYFNYEQGIAIQAQLAAYELDADLSRLERARALGEAVHSTFTSKELGGYNLQAGLEQVFTSYSAWTSFGHLALYDVDGDERWLDLARANADALARHMRKPDGSYRLKAMVCARRVAPDCEGGQGSIVIDQTVDGAANAWAQHLNIALTERLLRTR
jgi:hypothetical protein